MQIIESSIIGLRSAVYRFVHPELPVTVIAFPMIHIGTPEFYQEVRKRLMDCDAIIFEGVKSRRSRFLTASYRWAVKRQRLGLVMQAEALRIRELDKPLIHGDLSEAEFDEGWSGIRWWLRAVMNIGAPLYGLFLYFFGTREIIGKGMSLTDLSHRERRIEQGEDFKEYNSVLLDARDQRLNDVFTEWLESSKSEPRTVGIVYGAGHFTAFSDNLKKNHGFRAESAEWLTVFPYY